MLAAAGFPLLWPSPLFASPAVAVEEWTFLKSTAPNPSALAAFIEANWFAMDRIAVERGLLSDYRLMRSDDNGEWNLVIIVGYPDPRGYDAVRDAFEAIRRDHVPVLIDGKDLKALGRIVASRRVVPTGRGRAADAVPFPARPDAPTSRP